MKSLLIICLLFFTVSIGNAQEIFDAVKANDTLKVKTLVENNPEIIHAKDKDGRTPLHWACRGVYPEIVKYLAEKGADVNARDNNLVTPLISLANRNSIDGATILLRRGADPNIMDNTEQTPLHYAAARGFDEMVKILLEYNAETEPRNSYGRTPLVLAAREAGNPDVIKLLVERGSDINAADNNSATALVLAAWRGYETVVNYLIDSHADVPGSGAMANKLFEYALNKKLTRLYETILKNGGDAEKLIGNGTTAMHFAAKGGSKPIVDDLIKRKFDVNAMDSFGMTPLHYAAKYGRTEVIKTLIEDGAALNPKSRVEETPYNLAVKAGKKESADYLVSMGADSAKPVYTKLKGKYFGMEEPGDIPEAFAVGIASNLVGGHSNITFSPDGDEAYWTEWNETETGVADGCKILYSKIENGYWTVPGILVPKGDTPIFSGDGTGLYYLEMSSGDEIVCIKKENGASLPPKPVEFDLEQSGLYWQFSLDKNNNIYYATDNGMYRALCKNGRYLQPEKLSEIFHPDYQGMHPFISPEGDYLLFAAGAESGNSDLFIGYKKPDSTWTSPVNLGNKINSAGQEYFPIISGDGKYLFFGSGQTGFGNKCWVSAGFIEKYRPVE